MTDEVVREMKHHIAEPAARLADGGQARRAHRLDASARRPQLRYALGVTVLRQLHRVLAVRLAASPREQTARARVIRRVWYCVRILKTTRDDVGGSGR